MRLWDWVVHAKDTGCNEKTMKKEKNTKKKRKK